MRLADQVADGATLVPEAHDAGRTRMYSQFVFQRYGMHIVVLAKTPILIDEILRHQKQGNSLHSR